MRVLTRMVAWSMAWLSAGGVPNAFSQTGAPPAVMSTDTITASFDKPSQSIRLAPLETAFRIPDDISVRDFMTRPNFVSLDTEVQNGRSLMLEIYFTSSTCADWMQRKSASSDHKRKMQKPGSGLYDSRWSQTYFDRKGWTYLCLDRPGGTVQVETTPLDKLPREALFRLTANMADGLLPQTVQASTSAAAPTPAAIASSPAASPIERVTGVAQSPPISVDTVFPKSLGEAARSCASDTGAAQQYGQLNCGLLESFARMQKHCMQGLDQSCVSIAGIAEDEKDFATAAIYHQAACDRGEKASCKKALKFRQKAGL